MEKLMLKLPILLILASFQDIVVYKIMKHSY